MFNFFKKKQDLREFLKEDETYFLDLPEEDQERIAEVYKIEAELCVEVYKLEQLLSSKLYPSSLECGGLKLHPSPPQWGEQKRADQAQLNQFKRKQTMIHEQRKSLEKNIIMSDELERRQRESKGAK